MRFVPEMDIYKELNVIDRFEESRGNSAAVVRACDLMVSYLAGLKQPLPEIAARRLRIAIKKEGLASVGELKNERKALSDFLRGHSARTDYTTPEYCIVNAVEAALLSYENPEWGGGASELVSNFLDLTDRFESDHPLM